MFTTFLAPQFFGARVSRYMHFLAYFKNLRYVRFFFTKFWYRNFQMVSFRKIFELLSSFNCKYLFILKKERFHLKKNERKNFWIISFRCYVSTKMKFRFRGWDHKLIYHRKFFFKKTLLNILFILFVSPQVF